MTMAPRARTTEENDGVRDAVDPIAVDEPAAPPVDEPEPAEPDEPADDDALDEEEVHIGDVVRLDDPEEGGEARYAIVVDDGVICDLPAARTYELPLYGV